MEGRSELTLQEKIIAIQNQFKIAIQNHQFLVATKMFQNGDEKVKVHLNVINSVIFNTSKKQAYLLNQYRKEIAAKYDLKPNSTMVTSIMKKSLSFPDAPKHIPVYKNNTVNGDQENKKISVLKPKLMKSVLKVNNKNVNDSDKTKFLAGNKLNGTSLNGLDGSKIKIVHSKKKDGGSVLIQPTKKLQSVLKPKNIKSSLNEKLEKSEEGRQSPESSSSCSSGETKMKDSPPHNEIDLTESPTSLNKMDTRYGKKYEAKIMSNTKIKILFDNNLHKKDSVCDLEGKEQCSPRATKTIHLDQNPTSIEELDQETFLGIFRLVSTEKCEMLKKKRCERKRRSVAGQSSLYSDYFQPLPKRTYAPRKPAVPITNNNAVIEEPVADDDEDEKAVKADVCIVCHEEGALEVCHSCSEMYHVSCITSHQKGNCPNCMAQTTNIPNIVGANNSVGNASNSELIKRYSSEEPVSDNGNNDKKQTEPTNARK